MSEPTPNESMKEKIGLDMSNEIIVNLAIELPFWIPIKSGGYHLSNNREIKVRNDLWMISTTNIVDDPIGESFDFIVNEHQVSKRDFLEKIAQGKSRYFHKRKMKTTFTRSHSIIPIVGILSAKPLSEDWQSQLQRAVFIILQKQSKLEQFLHDSNLFIDYYSTLINPQNPSREVRRVSFYETMIDVRVICRNREFHYEYFTKLTPDLQMAGFPFPPFRVKESEQLIKFQDTIKKDSPPEFHQLQWIKTLNYKREKRYQEALLHANITLESLVHIYLSSKGFSKTKRKEKIKDVGLPDWVRNLEPPGLTEECETVAKLRELRNAIVHKEKKMTDQDIELVKNGIQCLTLLRAYLLEEGQPETLKLENIFDSFLDKVELGKAVSGKVGKMVPIKFGWRREEDCYQTVVEPSIQQSDGRNIITRIRNWLRRKN